MTKLWLVVDMNGRHGGYVYGIYKDLDEARLAAANTAAHCEVYELKAKPVE